MKSAGGEARVRGVLGLVAVVGGLVAVWWIVAAARVADHGFDVTDEGYYLLSYRWWSRNPLALTGVQYLYGPVFQLLDWNIVGLRVFRLVTVVVVHLLFGWSFLRWLRHRRPMAPATRLWEFAGLAVILAAGGMCYSWLPLSPGYNDVVLLGALLGVAAVFWAATEVDLGRKVPAWLLLLAGFVVAVMTLAKWTSVVVNAVVVGAALVVLAAGGRRAVVRGIGWALAGIAGTALFVHLLVMPLTDAVPGILAVNEFIAETSYSPVTLLAMYLTTGLELLGTTLLQHGLLLIATVVAVLARNARMRLAAWILAATGLGWSIYRVIATEAALGGTMNEERFPVTLLAAVLVVLAAAVTAVVTGRVRLGERPFMSQDKVRTWVLLALLLMIPLIQAFGTNNPLYVIGFNGFAAWAALMIAVVTGLDSVPTVARALTGAVLVSSLVAVASIVGTGLFRYPYRTSRYDQLTTTTTVAPLGALKLDPATAGKYTELAQRLRPYTHPSGRAMFGYDKMAGIILLLGGRPVGEAWVSPRERARAASGIQYVCDHGQPWTVQRLPLILLNRPISQIETDALGACAIDFRADYRLLAPAAQTMGLQVYVPRAERR